MNTSGTAFLRWFVSILLPMAVGALASFFTLESVHSWYPLLEKPAFTPPSKVFGPIWSLLYVLSGSSFFLIWQSSQTPQKKAAISVYFLQLVFNFGWSIFFFGFQNPGLASLDCFFLFCSVAWTLVAFWRIKRLAGALLIPYLLWVGFAFWITIEIWILNR